MSRAVVALACLSLVSGATAAQQRQLVPTAQVVLAPGDALRLNVWRHPELSGDFTVGVDSALIHPLYQTVRVGGLPLSVVRERIRTFLVTYEQNVQLTIEPLVSVTVAGEVRAPNLYRFPNGTTVAQAVALAGGPTDRGKMNHVDLIRSQGAVKLDLLREYQRSQSVSLASGDQVFVARKSDFNFLQDLIVPLTVFVSAAASLITLSRT